MSQEQWYWFFKQTKMRLLLEKAEGSGSASCAIFNTFFSACFPEPLFCLVCMCVFLLPRIFLQAFSFPMAPTSTSLFTAHKEEELTFTEFGQYARWFSILWKLFIFTLSMTSGYFDLILKVSKQRPKDFAPSHPARKGWSRNSNFWSVSDWLNQFLTHATQKFSLWH